MSNIRVSMTDMLPLIRESINKNGSVKIRVTGWSMQPMIYHRRDFVTLVKPPEILKKFDVAFYVRDNGSAILHRVIRIEKDGTYTFCGDNQWQREKGIRHDQIIAVVSDFTRNGKKIDVGSSAGYKFYVYTWPFLHHFKFMYKYYDRLKRLIKR